MLPDETALGEDIYPLIGVLERWDPQQLTDIYLSFPLQLVIAKQFDRTLNDGDKIHLFSKTQMDDLRQKIPATDEQRYQQKYTQQTASMQHQNSSALVAQGSSANMDLNIDTIKNNTVLASFLMERAVFLRGAVRKPGPYPIAEGVTLDNLLAVAGGLTLEANTSNIEITSANFGQNAQAHKRSGTHRTNIDFQGTNP